MYYEYFRSKQCCDRCIPAHRHDTEKYCKWSKLYRTDSADTGSLGCRKTGEFQKEIWNEINSMPWGANTSIQITDGAFRKMMEDSEFKNKMMKIIREDAIGSNKMCGGTLINIDENGYKGYSYMADHAKEAESAFSAHSKDKDSFYVKKAEKKREYRKLLEEKRLKQELAEKDLKAALERKRLTENAIERKQESGRMSRNVSAGANAAYEASFLMADGGSI